MTDNDRLRKSWQIEKDRVQLLGDSLHRVLINLGVLSQDSNPTYPELLLAAEMWCGEQEK